VEAEVKVDSVEVRETRSGNRRFVLRDSDGKEYTTFRPQIGEEAAKHEGRRARIKFHEQEKGGFTNVYLDGIEPLPGGAGGEDQQEAEEAAWQTAVEAAPWLIGKREPEKQVDPDELFDKLKPFQERVAADIRDGEEDE
jgi:hypothetical protein